jgi:hypothetical protein
MQMWQLVSEHIYKQWPVARQLMAAASQCELLLLLTALMQG